MNEVKSFISDLFQSINILQQWIHLSDLGNNDCTGIIDLEPLRTDVKRIEAKCFEWQGSLSRYFTARGDLFAKSTLNAGVEDYTKAITELDVLQEYHLQAIMLDCLAICE